MANRINTLFETQKKNLLSVFYTAGFPALNDTVRIGEYLEKAGADLIEIGIPFSDPVADGPTIQESNKKALDQGMNVALLLQQTMELRKKIKLPIILMGYLNPVFQYGMERFVKDAVAAGADGVILPDMPIAEYQREYKDLFDAHGLRNTFLISPTTSEERIRKIDALTNSFIYAVSSSATTGAQGDFSEEQEAYFKKLKNMGLKNPFLIGFGISNHTTFNKACAYSSGAIVGSSFITLLRNSQDLEKDIQGYVKNLKG